ncbi:DUF58 domain-containing protein [Thiomicrorhabdus sp.]|uniref:DUF58 domain-containing protein n=1 Tax=Thiomicrorhabdus sp. TaxID=2039724 RepID=UPI0029C85CB2|nr:DUF58 domain-containing protein [Thiomicrorhabdus sp.]
MQQAKLGALRFKPTSLGWVFALMAVIGWVMAVNYNNNLLFMLVFVLIALLLISLLLGWLSFANLQLVGVKTAPGFVGEKLQLQLFIRNSGRTLAEAVFVDCRQQNGGWENITGKSTQSVELELNAERRGQLALTPLNLASIYPVGLFVLYRKVQTELSEWAYPAPRGALRLKELLDQQQNHSGIEADEMQSLRHYQPSDNPSHINWKAYARSEELMSSDFSGGLNASSLMIDGNSLKHLPLELRLSQLAKWVLEAERLGLEYGLKLDTSVLSAAKGHAHKHQCLQMLAAYQMEKSEQTVSETQQAPAANFMSRVKTLLARDMGRGKSA